MSCDCDWDEARNKNQLSINFRCIDMLSPQMYFVSSLNLSVFICCYSFGKQHDNIPVNHHQWNVYASSDYYIHCVVVPHSRWKPKSAKESHLRPTFFAYFYFLFIANALYISYHQQLCALLHFYFTFSYIITWIQLYFACFSRLFFSTLSTKFNINIQKKSPVPIVLSNRITPAHRKERRQIATTIINTTDHGLNCCLFSAFSSLNSLRWIFVSHTVQFISLLLICAKRIKYSLRR